MELKIITLLIQLVFTELGSQSPDHNNEERLAVRHLFI